MTIREVLDGKHNSKVMLIFDVWKEKGSIDRTQVRLPYMNIEDVVWKYGDFDYVAWYTEGFDAETGRTIASLWAFADEERIVDPDLYENWTKLWEGSN